MSKDFNRRLDDLLARHPIARKRDGRKTRGAHPAAQNPDGFADAGRLLVAGAQIAADILGGLVVGAALGYGLGRLCGGMPVFLIAGALLGLAAGILNAWRTLKRGPAPDATEY